MKEEKVNDRVEDIASKVAARIYSTVTAWYDREKDEVGFEIDEDKAEKLVKEAISAAIEESRMERDRLSEKIIILDGAAHPCTEALFEKVSRISGENKEMSIRLECTQNSESFYRRLYFDSLNERETLKQEITSLREKVGKMEVDVKCRIQRARDSLPEFPHDDQIGHAFWAGEITALEQTLEALSHLTGEKKG